MISGTMSPKCFRIVLVVRLHDEYGESYINESVNTIEDEYGIAQKSELHMIPYRIDNETIFGAFS